MFSSFPGPCDSSLDRSLPLFFDPLDMLNDVSDNRYSYHVSTESPVQFVSINYGSGHVARLPAEDPAHRIRSCWDPGGLDERGRPHASRVRQEESYL